MITIFNLSADSLIAQTTHLKRLAGLWDSLSRSPVDREGASLSANLKAVWDKFLLLDTDVTTREVLRDLRRLGFSKIVSFYEKEFGEAPLLTIAQISRFASDFFSIRKAPVQSSVRGVNGPILIYDYPIQSAGVDCSISRCAGVIKWTNVIESASKDIVKFFSRGFLVPSSFFFDFKERFVIGEDREALSYEDSLNIERNFSAIRKQVASRPPVESTVMFSEKLIKAANIFDFAEQGGWQRLSVQNKRSFCRKMGRLAFLDLILGNTDRIIRVATSVDCFEEHPLESNLGNFMIIPPRKEEEGITFFAIDNGIDSRFLKTDREGLLFKAEYLEFLKDLLADKESFALRIAQQMQRCIAKTLNPKDNDEYRGFVADLCSREASADFVLGIQDMRSYCNHGFDTFECISGLEVIKRKYIPKPPASFFEGSGLESVLHCGESEELEELFSGFIERLACV